MSRDLDRQGCDLRQSRSASSRAARSRPVGLDRCRGDRPVQGGEQLGAERVGVDELLVGQVGAGAVALEPVPHVPVLLEVVAQRHVEEGPSRRGQLHAGREPALHHGHVARRELPPEVGHEAEHRGTAAPGQRARVDPRPGHDDEAQVGPGPAGRGHRVEHPPQQVAPDGGAAHGHDAHGLVVAPAQGLPQAGALLLVRWREPADVAGEVELGLGPARIDGSPGPNASGTTSSGVPTKTDRSRTHGKRSRCSSISAL